MKRTPVSEARQQNHPHDVSKKIRGEIESLQPWFHNLHLPDGSQTAPEHPLGDFPANQWEHIKGRLPEHLEGQHILDIGCNAGFYSIQLALRGAQVTAMDVNPHYLRQARWVAAIFGMAKRIQFVRHSIYDLGRDSQKYDGVLFMGLLYHLRYPLLGLDLAARCVKHWMLFQTMLAPDEAVIEPAENHPLDEREDFIRPGWPKLAFIEKRLAGDPTNWWVANHAAVIAMLRSSGLEVLERIGREYYLCRPLSGPLRAADMIKAELGALYGQDRIT